jgi:hypothetical protein
LLKTIFPATIDNRFAGHWLALWLFVPLVLLRLVIGTNSMVMTASVAMGADGIPLNTFSPPAAAVTLALFSLLGLSDLILALLCALALFRYRAMIPLLYLLLVVQLIGGRVLSVVYPIAHAGATTVGSSGISAGMIVSYSLMALTVLGFILSLAGKRAQ